MNFAVVDGEPGILAYYSLPASFANQLPVGIVNTRVAPFDGHEQGRKCLGGQYKSRAIGQLPGRFRIAGFGVGPEYLLAVFCHISNYWPDLAREKQERAALAEAKNNLENQLAEAIRMVGKGGMTVAETSLVFYYLFDEMGVDFSNSDKTKWARFIHAITGKSEQRIRNSLYFDFDQKSTRKNLRSIAGIFSELFPAIKQKILNDMQET